MHLLVLLLGEFPRLNQLCSSHTLELLMGARGHLKNLTQHLALLLTLDLNLKRDIQRILEKCKKTKKTKQKDNTEVLYRHKPALFAVLYSVVQTAVEMWAPVSAAAVAGPALEPA